MKKLFYILAALTLLGAHAGGAERYNLIPMPASLTAREGSFTLREGMAMSLPAGDGYVRGAEILLEEIKTAGGPAIKVTTKGRNAAITVFADAAIAPEGYSLKVDRRGVSITCSTPQGMFYALATLRQLLPAQVYGGSGSGPWSIPCVEITDAPRFGYRGAHLDCCRHFMSVDFVCRYIDLMSRYKLNRFHWHLTDDQGWRIEIKKYPLLTSVGSVRPQTLIGHKRNLPHTFDGVPHGGYYTREDVRRVVDYAAARGVMVIPEIEMPGHATAAVAAYPFLACGLKEKYEVACSWGVFEDGFCPKQTTFTFLEDVLREVAEMFPAPYIHIGGDECPKVAWKQCPHCQSLIREKGLNGEAGLQSYFMHHMDNFVNSLGRTAIGWDEILEGGISPNAVVMSWRGYEGGIEAARLNHSVIMAPHKQCYLDYYQEPRATAPLAQGGNLPLDSVYMLEPVPPMLTADQAKYIMGVQANCWVEYLPTPSHVEYMVFPRLGALAEVAWTPADRKDRDSFHRRLETEFDRFERMGVRACQYERKNR